MKFLTSFIFLLTLSLFADIYDISDVVINNKQLIVKSTEAPVNGVVFGKTTLGEIIRVLPENFLENMVLSESYSKQQQLNEKLKKNGHALDGNEKSVLYEVKNGNVTTCYISYKLKSFATTVVKVKNNQLHGSFLGFNLQGLSITEFNFVNGKKEGVAFSDSRSNKLSYKNDIFDGMQLRYRGPLAEKEEMYKKGVLHGISSFYDVEYDKTKGTFSREIERQYIYVLGQIHVKKSYRNGALISYDEFYPNGKKKMRASSNSRTEYIDEWDESGKKIKTTEFKIGEKLKEFDKK